MIRQFRQERYLRRVPSLMVSRVSKCGRWSVKPSRRERYPLLTPNHVTQADLVDPPVLIRLCERGAEPLLETNLTILITRCRIAWLFRLLREQKIASSNLATETRRKITVSGGVWPSSPVWETESRGFESHQTNHYMDE